MAKCFITEGLVPGGVELIRGGCDIECEEPNTDSFFPLGSTIFLCSRG